jgi:NDP-sugar pyrophosphorylase family protein
MWNVLVGYIYKTGSSMMKHAVILAGGKGERLRPLTQDRPKCMVEVLGTPILGYQLNWLKTHGITDIVIACGYLHELIESRFGSGANLGVNLRYVVEKEPLGRGGALKNAMKEINSVNQPIVALNGDNVTNLSLLDVLDYHQAQNCLATMVTIPFQSSFGIVEIDPTGKVMGFREKPTLPYYLNAGIYILEPEIVNHLPDVGDHETETFPKLVASGLLSAYRSNSFWRTIDTVKDVNVLGAELEGIFLNALFRQQSAEPNPSAYHP